MKTFRNSLFLLFYIVLGSFCIFFASCTPENEKTTYFNQDRSISNFIEKFIRANVEQLIDKNLDEKEKTKLREEYYEDLKEKRLFYNKGVARLILTPGSGDAVVSSNSSISMLYAGYVFNGGTPIATNLFVTNIEEVAKNTKFELSEPMKVKDFNLKDKELLKGLKLGLQGMQEGEEAWIIFNGEKAFQDKAFQNIPKFSALIYKVKIEKIN